MYSDFTQATFWITLLFIAVIMGAIQGTCGYLTLLERKIIALVRLFRFDPKDVDAVTTTKPIDFFPA